ncbi:MAG: DUF1080 domain-containing protein [Pirellulales bacterium]
MIWKTARRFCLSLVLMMVSAATLTAAADEPVGLKLLRPDSLAGWDYALDPPANWIISEGRLTGTAESTQLVSGFTCDDFELRCQWSVKPGGEWQIALLDVPSGPGLTIALREGAGSGAVAERGEDRAPGIEIQPLAAPEMHTAQLRRFGDTLSVIIDGRLASEIAVDANRRFGLALSVPKGEASLQELRWREPRGNPLNNGRDLTGWFVNNDKGTWKVDNGDFVPTSHRGLHYLRPDKEYANFTLSLKYTISRGGNSGLAIRTAKDGWPSGDGMELQILDRPGLVKDSTMSIYGNLPPLDRADRSLEWNEVVVKADGRMISAWINGELVQQANTAWLSEVRHRHLRGWIGVQDHGGNVRFREIYLHEAPDGLGLDAWYAPRKEAGAAIVLDRLMNSQRLSQADRIRSGVVATAVSKGGEHVLAELTGPGALVSCWSDFPSGQMALYFDGETEPRIRCPAEHLFDHVPGVSHEKQPTLMCLPYAKSLKISLAEPLETHYRLEYVTFPAEMPCETFTALRSGVPRGALPAITYRHDGMSGGKLREAEIYDRVASEPRTIEPGTSVDLLKLEGAGLVNWLRLTADRAVLANNDLWLEVTVDGESIPAIAAPARYYYPGFASTEKQGFSSLVLTQKEGFANLLAMPYGNGLVVTARNRGTSPIANLSLSASVDHATEQNRADYAGRMRLRGIFQLAGDAERPLVQQTGAGRWVGFVYEQPQDATTGIADVEIDGQSSVGWSMEYLDPLFGRPGEPQNFFTALAGRQGNLAWRYMMLAPVTFEKSLVVRANASDQVGERLALFYLQP